MLIFLAVLIVVVYFVQAHSQKRALKDVDYDYKFSKQLVEADESFELISTIVNRSRRFIPFIRMEETLPKGVCAIHQSVGLREDVLGHLRYDSTIYMMPRSKLERRLEIVFSARGCYLFHGGKLHGGDFLGLKEKRESFQEFREVVVYPKGVNVGQLEQMLSGFLGDISVRRFIMEDPILTIGTREYTGSESLNRISWKHSARSGELMVKQFDYTVETVVTVVLDINTPSGTPVDFQHVENCFSLARSVCQLFKDKHIAFDFVSNGRIQTSKTQKQRLDQNTRNVSLLDILERLGRSTYQPIETFEETIQDVKWRQDKGQGTIVITPQKDENKETLANTYLATAGSTVIFMYGEDVDGFN